MQFVKQTGPYIRKDISTKRMMIDVLIALIPVVLFAVYRFGGDAIIRIVISVIVMVGLEALVFGLMQKPDNSERWIDKIKSRYKNYTINHITAPAVSAVIFALLVPSKLPLYAVIVGAAFAIVVVKMMFGGLGSNIFNVAAAGRIFIALALTNMFAGTYQGVDMVAGGTALTTIRSGLGFPQVLNSYSLSDLFFGNIPGAMGEISALAILIGLAYLLIRRSADYRVVLSTLISFVLLIAIAGYKLYPGQTLEFVLFHLFSGGILFGAAFMVTDPVTSPLTRPGRWLYGLLIGVLIVLIRLFGAYPEGVAFAILFANMFVPLIDYFKWSTNRIRPPFIIGYVVVLIIMALVVFFGVGGAA
jgi:electron transport complex protein RnfD